ncbi:MAG TPA: efflux RND transporter periplasmic adaptor subunit [Terriglobales bacterium]|nr:efflux RND transporter periplasmic adaptor subunit [Terriglobales bacterium]
MSVEIPTTGRSILKAALITAVVTIAIAGFTGCSKENAQAAGPQRPAAPVIVSTVEQRDVPLQITAIGNVEAYQTVQIRSMVSGQIESIHFKEGDDVRQGQLLYSLDKRPFQAAVQQAVGNLKRDQAQAANARVQAARYTDLEKQGVISREQAELQRTAEDTNVAAVAADEAAVQAAKVQLQYTDIYAPIDSRAGALMINVGNLVKANDTPYLVQLNQITPIYVTFTVPESRLSEVRRFAASGLKVLAYPKGDNSMAAEGKLTFIDNGVDPQTGTVKLKATFQNTDKRLWPGEFVDVVLNISTTKNAITVPTKAVQSGQQGDYVFVIAKDGTADPRQVDTAGTYKNLTLVKSGLKPGETVIVDGQLRVAPKAKVAVQSSLPPDQVVGNGINSSDTATGTVGGGQ